MLKSQNIYQVKVKNMFERCRILANRTSTYNKTTNWFERVIYRLFE